MHVYIPPQTNIQYMTTKNNTTTKKITSPPDDEYQIQTHLQEIQLYKNWKPSTLRTYTQTLKVYCQYHNTTLPLLLEEATQDEETIRKVNKRRIKKRIIDYILHMQNNGNQPRTIKLHISRILLLYKFNDIETPTIPPIQVPQTTSYEDLPTREEIQHALRHSNTKTRALITALASSGMRVSDLSNLTVADFVDACSMYVPMYTGLFDFLHKLLKNSDLIIPMYNVNSQKTGVRYNTFMSDEATRYIAEYLVEYLSRHSISMSDRLFMVDSSSISLRLRRLNNKLGLGLGGRYARLHPHGLRKFFATQLTNNDCDYLSVEFMMGHKLDQVRDAYYKSDPERLRLKYRQYMEHLTFLEEISYRDVTTSELEELEELRRFRRDTDTKLSRLEDMMNRLSFDLDMEVR